MDDLVALADSMGCRIGLADIGDQALFVAADGAEPPVILLPTVEGLLGMWLLAHELGHLIHHSGPRGELLYSKDEAQASRWAAKALIPAARIRAHGNASMDAFIGALSAHYEDISMMDCPERHLAATIAMARLKSLEDVA